MYDLQSCPICVGSGEGALAGCGGGGGGAWVQPFACIGGGAGEGARPTWGIVDCHPAGARGGELPRLTAWYGEGVCRGGGYG